MPIIPIVKTSLFCATILGKSLWHIARVCKQANSLNVRMSLRDDIVTVDDIRHTLASIHHVAQRRVYCASIAHEYRRWCAHIQNLALMNISRCPVIADGLTYAVLAMSSSWAVEGL